MLRSSRRWYEVSAKSPGVSCPERQTRPGSSRDEPRVRRERLEVPYQRRLLARVATGPEDRRVAGDRERDRDHPGDEQHLPRRWLQRRQQRERRHDVRHVRAPHRRLPHEQRDHHDDPQHEEPDHDGRARGRRPSRLAAGGRSARPTSPRRARGRRPPTCRGPRGSRPACGRRRRAWRCAWRPGGTSTTGRTRRRCRRAGRSPRTRRPRSPPPPPRRARRSGVRRFESSTIRPAITRAGTESALIDTAAPAASPIHAAVRRRGWSR